MHVTKTQCVALFGGSGFIGRSLARQLADAGYRVRVVTRREPVAGPLSVLPNVEFHTLAGRDAAAMAKSLEGVDALVNLVGILHESGRKTFQAAHVDWVVQLIEAAKQAGVHRFIHISAVGASKDAPSRYLRSKAEAEAVLKGSGLAVTILSPSVVFGPEDQFLNMFAGLLAVMPLVPLAGASARFQPVYVEDVAKAVLICLQNPKTIGLTLPLGGPDEVSLSELIRRVGQWSGHSRPVIPLPYAAGYMQALMMEMMPVPLMTRDNLRSMLVPSIAGPFPEILGFKPQSMDAIVPKYLGTQKDAFSPYRRLAGR